MIEHEWTLETLAGEPHPTDSSLDAADGEPRDIDAVDFGTVANLLRDFDPLNQRIGLVRDFHPKRGRFIRRSWAYLVNGRLPEHFSESDGRPDTKVPAKYHRELAAALATVAEVAR